MATQHSRAGDPSEIHVSRMIDWKLPLWGLLGILATAITTAVTTNLGIANLKETQARMERQLETATNRQEARLEQMQSDMKTMNTQMSMRAVDAAKAEGKIEALQSAVDGIKVQLNRDRPR